MVDGNSDELGQLQRCHAREQRQERAGGADERLRNDADETSDSCVFSA